MTISIWRYSHLALAVCSSLFLIVASITGLILSFEPITDATRGYAVEDLSAVKVSRTMSALDEQYEETLELEVDVNDYVLASVITKEGESERIYIHPITGAKLGYPKEKSRLFQWTTNLHRSLFLKGIGRFFVGLISFLLCLITVTGVFLLAKRQGGVSKLFTKVQKDSFEQRYHVVISRWFMLPVLIVAATGVFLSAEKFSILPSGNVTHSKLIIQDDEIPERGRRQLALFETFTLDNVRKLTFPFSEFPEDYFELALTDKELYIHQYTGEILSEVPYPFVTLAARLSLTLHTGQGSVLWSVILLATCVSLLFFMYTGFAMALKRRRTVKATTPELDKDKCEFILLVGSETGTTNYFATLFQNALHKAGKRVYKAELNQFTDYKKAAHIIVFTATYGEGEAPTNARKFREKFTTTQSDQLINYSVVGFGSLVYPDYCKFATEVDTVFRTRSNFTETLPLYKINNQSFAAFTDWSRQWCNTTGIQLTIKAPKETKKTSKKKAFKVVHRTPLNDDNTFLVRLRPEKKVKFQSGDLLSYQPKEDGVPRLYSIAKIQDDILLSIKRHEFGLCSNHLNNLKHDDLVYMGIKRNPNFHFPKKAKEIICISNGTGIAPFLGIVDENKDYIPISLFWGGRNKSAFTAYEETINQYITSGKLAEISIAYSQADDQKRYVQHLIAEQKIALAQKLKSGAAIMICGSIAMQNEVLTILEEIATIELHSSLSDFEHREQLKMDCY
ncbi:PepSY domain-containing protein [Maribacter chungangensis]|uniref:NADPH--hemoprotein reductase n=1 Tax=Maribacter chungangensis TaxID=1069117 RepID=A0ABW3B171_9FLAO